MLHVFLLCSPEDAFQLFTTHRITEAQFSQQGSQLAADSSLMCRIESALYPWQQVAPVVMGSLAFGWDWQQMLPPGGGIPMAVPASEARQFEQDSQKVTHAACLLGGSCPRQTKLVMKCFLSGWSGL